MIEKPDWLFKGALVKALGEIGKVTKCPTNEIKGKTYVYGCQVKIQGSRFTRPYHPSDLSQLEK